MNIPGLVGTVLYWILNVILWIYFCIYVQCLFPLSPFFHFYWILHWVEPRSVLLSCKKCFCFLRSWFLKQKDIFFRKEGRWTEFSKGWRDCSEPFCFVLFVYAWVHCICCLQDFYLTWKSSHIDMQPHPRETIYLATQVPEEQPCQPKEIPVHSDSFLKSIILSKIGIFQFSRLQIDFLFGLLWFKHECFCFQLQSWDKW